MMTCNMCPDEAVEFVECTAGVMCFCSFCADRWLCMFIAHQPSVEAFYGSP